MKHKMILILFLYCSSIFSTSIGQSKVQEYRIEKAVIIQDTVPVREAICTVENFYRAYTASFLSDLPSNGSLDMEKYLTKRLLEKIERVRTATGSDPIIRAQDFNETAFETLNAKPLGDNWYMVNYRWNKNDDRSNTNIPLKVASVDGHYMIDYITPVWNGSLYGDTLLCEDIPQRPVDNTSPQSMLETFYAAYTFLYYSMPEGLFPQLEALRTAHLTPNARKQFNQASVNMYELDRVRNYDLLIDYFDFDCLWIPSITYTPLNESTFQVSYVKWGNLFATVTIGIIESYGEYKIDSIRLEK